MKAVFDERQRQHDPQFRLQDGKVIVNPDRPERVGELLKGVGKAGLVLTEAADHGMAPLAALHTPRYLDYLRNIHARRSALAAGLAEVVPGRIAPDRNVHYSYETEAQIGYHNADTSCPISAASWDAIYWSAQTALTGADLVLAGERAAYALSRPSGHHAYREVSGGFCFLNNSGIAAEYLRSKGHRPAILDIDVHHGNGTQGIFYDRDDVLTISLHADPAEFYPFYSGGAQECGAGRGVGYNLNLPLARGAGDEAYLAALDRALGQIAAFGASAVVVALGLDAHEDDPFQGLKVTAAGFSRIARRIAGLGLPVLNVQEGGYMQPALGDNLASYLGGLQGA
ncbi:acetoin utilization deacetylase AcuC-like enzyme [Pseudochelatococcus lubricantis]|uniref:Acetoin utilization deacetylase AcuC-like enzyme n=1 Tax=Pseudochelatococcus lubricantis TaxID=1538102 RepID=A0ABX0V124_9HYPH|nr:histone deacetylase family protein [Pseudochelatococcus lubricantis]NIJ58852.1 acetoin utilization deacetylase AcuC-like enzyme [Pseudochelatococcus lubricantis]